MPTPNKKFLFILTSTSFGGLELNVVNLASHLNSQGNKVNFVCVHDSLSCQKIYSYNQLTTIKKNNSHSDQQSTQLKNEAIVNNDNVLIHTLKKAPPKYVAIFSAYRIYKLVKQIQPENIIISTANDLDLLFWTIFWTYIKFEKFPAKVFYLQQMQLGVSKKDWYHRLKFSCIDRWISPLEWLKNEVISKTNLSEQKIDVLPLCFNTSKYLEYFAQVQPDEIKKKLHLPFNKFIFSIIGRIDPGKGQLEVLKAFHAALKSQANFNNAVLCIIGSPTLHEHKSQNYYQTILNFVQSNQLQKNTIFFSHVSDPLEFYASTDCQIIASQKETFGMVTIEGLLSHAILIGANSGGTIDLLEHGQLGVLFNIDRSEQQEELKQLMIEIFNNPERYRQKYKRDRSALAEKYSLSRYSAYFNS